MRYLMILFLSVVLVIDTSASIINSEELLQELLKEGKRGSLNIDHDRDDETSCLSLQLSDSHETSFMAGNKAVDRLISFNGYQVGNAVTYSFSDGGRLGDNLTAFLHAKWISFKYGLPLLHQPFAMSERFLLSDIHPLASGYKFQKVVRVSDESQISIQPESTLFVIPYFAEPFCERYLFDLGPFADFDTQWHQPDFRREYKECLTPKYPVNDFDFPEGCKTIAVHVRRGGGFDDPALNRIFIEKFPPDSFFFEQLQLVAEIYKDQLLFVHLFTDDRNPKALREKYRNAMNHPLMIFSCREENNRHDANVIDDLLAMSMFDCLIRGSSSYGIIASLLGNHELVIYPVKGHWDGTQQIMDKIQIDFCRTGGGGEVPF